MSNLRNKLIKLAFDNPELRSDILPLLKESARRIHIDPSILNEAEKAVLDSVRKKLRKPSSPRSSLMSSYMRDTHLEGEVTVVSLKGVSGEVVRVPILWGIHPKRTGAVDGRGRLAVFINSSKPWKQALAEFERNLRSTLEHELVHLSEHKFLETIQKRGPQDPSDLSAYYNDLYEVRAYLAELYSEIRNTVLQHVGRGKKLDRAILDALGGSDRWKQMEPYLERRTRNHLLKGLVTSFNDEIIEENPE